jgi:hypothetical protein
LLLTADVKDKLEAIRAASVSDRPATSALGMRPFA